MNANRLGWTVGMCAAIGGSAASVLAGVTYSSATRSVSASSRTSYERWGYHPSDRSLSGPGEFRVGLFAFASGDFGVESQAWQWSRFNADAMDIRLTAWGIVNGTYDPGAWFYQSSVSAASARVTIDTETPYWISIDDNGFTTNGIASIRSLDGAFEVRFEHDGIWEGLLAPGQYDMEFVATCQSGGNGAGLLSAVIGVPNAGTLGLVGAAGLMMPRRRRKS